MQDKLRRLQMQNSVGGVGNSRSCPLPRNNRTQNTKGTSKSGGGGKKPPPGKGKYAGSPSEDDDEDIDRYITDKVNPIQRMNPLSKY
ncbi:MAG: hypothetical protein HC877_22395 [Thioploca sp.]|nr:hypothetical protein [Thioploca sp.]